MTNLIDRLPERFRRILISAGITTPEAAIAAGEDGLLAIDGIGPKTAVLILEVAAEMMPEPEPEQESEEITPDSDAQDADVPEQESEEITPDSAPATAVLRGQRPEWGILRLVGRTSAVVGGRVMYVNETNQVPYRHLIRAADEYPPGTFLVRFPDDQEFRVL